MGMENKQVNHILNSSGILKIFNISKKVEATAIDNFIKTHKNDCSTKYELQELLREELFEHTIRYLNDHKIPGLIIPPKTETEKEQEEAEEVEESTERKTYHINDKRLIKVRENSHALSEMLKKKKLSKKELIFFVISLTEFLRLKEEDFDKFREDMEDSGDFNETED